MRIDNTTKRTKSQGWPQRAILGFLSASYHAHTGLIAAARRFRRLRILQK